MPQHFFCHCTTKPLSYSQVVNEATAESAFSKFNPYLFNRGLVYPHNKQKLFESWGYTIDDAEWMQKTIEEQGIEKYVNGEYSLGKLDKNGQRISIRVEIPTKKWKCFLYNGQDGLSRWSHSIIYTIRRKVI